MVPRAPRPYVREPAAYGLFALAGCMAAAALLGPLGLRVVRFHVSPALEHQLVGSELAAVLGAAPLACAAGVLWRRRHPLGPALALGPALFAVYTYPQYVVGPDYVRYPGNNEGAFPLYLALVVLGWAVALRAWRALGAAGLPPPHARLRRVAGGLSVVVSLLFALAWGASVAAVIAGAGPVAGYREAPALFWLVRLMDLGFVIPAGLVAGVGLLRDAPWAGRLAYAYAGLQTLLVCAVAAMALVMTAREDPSADPVVLAVSVAAGLALLTTYAWLVGVAAHGGRATRGGGAGGPTAA